MGASPGTGRARRRGADVVVLVLLLAAALGNVTVTSARATSFGPQEYWQHLGYSFEPCATIEIRPNLESAREPATMRAIAGEAIDVWNTAIGRAALRLGPDTTASADRRFDGTNTLEVTTSAAGGFGGVGGPSSATIGGRMRIVEADIEIFDFDGLALNDQVRDILLLTMIHEIGHGLGFLHTVDPDSPMSYVAPTGPTMDVDTTRVIRQLLTAPCGSYPRVSTDVDLVADFARDKRVDFEHISRTVQPLLDSTVEDTIEAGVALAHLRLNEPEPVTRAVVCRHDIFADCLAASPLAGPEGIVVYVPGGPAGTLPATVRDVLRRAFPVDRGLADVVIVGGENAVSRGVAAQLREEGFGVERIWGENRYGTATAIASRVAGDDATVVVLARGDDPADAMTAGVLLARDRLPLVLTRPGELPRETRTQLERLDLERIVVLGGPAAVSAAVEGELREHAPSIVRVQGAERSGTSVGIARDLMQYVSIPRNAPPLTLLNGHDPSAWALAIAFAPLGAVTGSPVLLTRADGFLPATAAGPGVAPGSGRFLADLDLADTHDGSGSGGPAAFFQSLGTETGRFTPLQAMRYADQILLYCRWYFDDCQQEGVT